MSIIDYSELTYISPVTGVYNYPKWAIGIGWAIAAASGIFIPIIAVYKIIRYVFIDRKVSINNGGVITLYCELSDDATTSKSEFESMLYIHHEMFYHTHTHTHTHRERERERERERKRVSSTSLYIRHISEL